MKNKAMKAVSKAMREKTDESLSELKNCPNWMFRLVIGLKTDSKKVDGGSCIRGCDEKLCLSEMERGKAWQNNIERIMNEENDWIIMWNEMQ